eukprot:TRINITY_DN50618_c0_g1_i1.p1 TRINITY_DN50618_c0_g1~~TRINITY_DN50618_c0_g1_i1.p1  ORF type:complete len:310 (+),score=114.24 TRINITY_DN50618_c0_g1_i1:82-930(+)
MLGPMTVDMGGLIGVDYSKEVRRQASTIVTTPEEDCTEADAPPFAVCPVPRTIPRLDLKKGTTTLGFVFQGGVILAVDSRASSGQYIASRTVQKVITINEYLLGTMAGGAADCMYWNRWLGTECRLWELRNKSRITIAAASKILGNLTYSMRNHGLSMGTMVAGVDHRGPQLWSVDDHGTRMKLNMLSHGSGSIYAYGVLDQGWRYDMSPEEAQNLGRKAVLISTHRDGYSGGNVQVYWIHAKDEQGRGWTKISKTDMMDLWDEAQKDGSVAPVMDPHGGAP